MSSATRQKAYSANAARRFGAGRNREASAKVRAWTRTMRAQCALSARGVAKESRWTDMMGRGKGRRGFHSQPDQRLTDPTVPGGAAAWSRQPAARG